jgi:outer membrane protein assembly factor BamE (lipoprotein component of BamABCDE complex)
MASDPRPVNATPRRPRRTVPVLALSLALAGCSLFESPTTLRGNRVDEDQLAQITPGVQTRADVLALLGSPSARGTFDEDHWYYISQTTRLRPGALPRVEDQKVVALTFDRGGVVREVRQLTLADAQPVQPVTRSTPVPGNDRTVLQQLFGNIGRFGPGGPTAPVTPGPTSTR